MPKQSFINNAIILMVAGFIVRIFGFFYRIYLANLIGAEGMGLFQLISPIYSLVILTLTSGISIAVSKLVAEEYAKHNYINLRRITSLALGLVLSLGLIVSIFMYIKIDFIVDIILKDRRTYYSMILLIPCIPIIAAASAIKGYFYGMQEVTPTAVSQIAEQIVRISIVVLTAGYFVKIGLEYACALAVVGMLIGEMSNLAVVAIVYRVRKKKEDTKNRAGILRKRKILKEIMKISLPVSANRFITSIMFAVEMILIPRKLLESGMNYKYSMEEFGKLSGMAMPLIFFPSLVTSALATALVPAISEAVSIKNYRTANYRISKSLQLTSVLGFIFMAIFISFPNEISDVVYKNQNIGSLLFLLAFSCVFMYLQQILLGVLNGLGKQGISLRNSMIGYVLRIGFVYLCIPVYGLKGYIIGIIISAAIVCFLNMHTVIKSTGMVMDFRNWIVKPGLVCLITTFSSKYIYSFFSIFGFKDRWLSVTAILGSIIVGLMLMFVVGALNKKETINLIKSRGRRTR